MKLAKFNTYSPTLWDSLFDGYTSRFFDESVVLSPRANVVDKGNEIHVSLEMPGVSKDNIQLRVDSNVLTVSAERKHEKREEKDNVYVNEFAYGKFERSFRLSEDIDAESIKGTYENGVLEVKLTKKPQAAPKIINID